MTFSFIQVTDHHLPAAETTFRLGYSAWHAFRMTVRALAARHAASADFLVSTGDLVDKGTDAEYAFVTQTLGLHAPADPPGPQPLTFEGLRAMPTYFLPGNHDAREPFMRHLFQRAGGSLLNASFVHKGIQFVCLDFGTENQAIMHPQTLAFLRERLQAGAPTVILTHHQLVASGVPHMDDFLPVDPERVAELLPGRNVLGIFCGHFHLSYEGTLGGVPVYGTRSTMLSVVDAGDKKIHYVAGDTHYRVVAVDGERLSTEIVAAPL